MTRDHELERRVLDLRARASEHLAGPVEETFAWLICDRCGLRVRISDDLDRPLMDTTGWGKGPEGDLCPACAGGEPGLTVDLSRESAFPNLAAQNGFDVTTCEVCGGPLDAEHPWRRGRDGAAIHELCLGEPA